MLAVPPALLDVLQLQAGAKVEIAVESGRLIVQPRRRPHYSLDQLLSLCRPQSRRTRQEREWLTAKPRGRELI